MRSRPAAAWTTQARRRSGSGRLRPLSCPSPRLHVKRPRSQEKRCTTCCVRRISVWSPTMPGTARVIPAVPWSMIKRFGPHGCRAVRAQGGRIDTHLQSFEESFYVMEGTPTLILEGVGYPLAPGACGLIPVGAQHAWLGPKRQGQVDRHDGAPSHDPRVRTTTLTSSVRRRRWKWRNSTSAIRGRGIFSAWPRTTSCSTSSSSVPARTPPRSRRA